MRLHKNSLRRQATLDRLASREFGHTDVSIDDLGKSTDRIMDKNIKRLCQTAQTTTAITGVNNGVDGQILLKTVLTNMTVAIERRRGTKKPPIMKRLHDRNAKVAELRNRRAENKAALYYENVRCRFDSSQLVFELMVGVAIPDRIYTGHRHEKRGPDPESQRCIYRTPGRSGHALLTSPFACDV